MAELAIYKKVRGATNPDELIRNFTIGGTLRGLIHKKTPANTDGRPRASLLMGIPGLPEIIPGELMSIIETDNNIVFDIWY